MVGVGPRDHLAFVGRGNPHRTRDRFGIEEARFFLGLLAIVARILPDLPSELDLVHHPCMGRHGLELLVLCLADHRATLHQSAKGHHPENGFDADDRGGQHARIVFFALKHRNVHLSCRLEMSKTSKLSTSFQFFKTGSPIESSGIHPVTLAAETLPSLCNRVSIPF